MTEEEEAAAVVTGCELKDADVAVEAENAKKDMSKKRNCHCFLRQNFLIFPFKYFPSSKKTEISLFPPISANCHLATVKKTQLAKLPKLMDCCCSFDIAAASLCCCSLPSLAPLLLLPVPAPMSNWLLVANSWPKLWPSPLGQW
jgi:hypothetical protein